MTDIDSNRTVQRVRHPLKFRMGTVLRTRFVTPHLLSVTFGGEDFRDFVSASFDDHVKLFFPAPGEDAPDLPERGPDALPLPGGPRPVMRDYTPRRRFDPIAAELDIEFVLHGDGPASTWAAQARPGQVLGIGGPRGSFVIPNDFDWHLLVGDETALPAIARRLGELPAQTHAIVVVAGQDEPSRPALTSAARLDVTWTSRQDAGAGAGNPLRHVLGGMSRPPGDGYVWAAGEASEMASVRAHLVQAWSIDKGRIRASSYWKHGAQAHHETLDA